jgi:Na+-transporting NADH:ubiquinone oxidoreductase subunit F
MNFIPLLVMNGLLLIITILLAIADKLLVSYGACKITVSQEGEEKEFTVQGGDNLLTYLSEHGVEINSSCGGKGSCGYCKVRVIEGGGPILPTEEIFMSRQEMQENMRLACQVKVKNDLKILIPDYLAVVRQMVLNNKFDPNKRWKVYIE